MKRKTIKQKLRLAEKEIKRLQDTAVSYDNYLDTRISWDEKTVSFLNVDVQDRDAKIAKLKLLHSKEDIDRLENRVARRQKKLARREAIIAELEEAHLEDVDRLKKRLERYERKIQRRNATIAEFEQKMMTKINHLDQILDHTFQEYEFRLDLRRALPAIGNATNSLTNVVDNYMNEINDDQAKLNAKIDNIDRFVKGLQQEGKVYYDKIADPDDYIRQIDGKLENRENTIERLSDKLKAAGAKMNKD